MIYLRSRLGRAMPEIGRGDHSTSPGEPGDPSSAKSQAATLDDFGEFGEPECHLHLVGQRFEEQIKVLNQQAGERGFQSQGSAPEPP